MLTNPKDPTEGKDGTIYMNLLIINPSVSEKRFTSTQMNEEDYLNSETWKVIRQAKLASDHYTCQKCGKLATEVHHLYYPKTAWGMENIDTDLISLCHCCHAEIHHRLKPKDFENFGEPF